MTRGRVTWTMLTHWGGLMSLAESAGLGSRNFVSWRVEGIINRFLLLAI